MKPVQAFGVSIRTVGLIACLAAVLYLISGVIASISPGCKANVSPAWQYFIVGLVVLIIGLYFLGGAPHVLRLAYRDDSPDSERSNDA
jgi:hypothetical protein